MGIESDFIWFDGHLVPFADAKVHVLAHALHYGMAAFEGVRAYEQPDGRPGIWRLDAHIGRLLDSCRMVKIPCTFDHATISEACLSVLEANRFNAAYLRPIVFNGAKSMGLGARDNPVHTVVAAWHWGAYVGEEALARGIRLKTSSFVRHHPNAALQRAKISGNYVNNCIARYEAADDGYDEALMLDHTGLVAEGTGENLFLVKGGEVWTPPPINVLPGITRQSVMDLLTAEGFVVREVPFGRDAVYVADEVFLTGTAAEITPVAEIDRRPIGRGDRPVTRRVQEGYAAMVRGRDPRFVQGITTRDAR